MPKNFNPLNYYGFVTIKKLKNGKIVNSITTHNAGTLWLFKLLANALCGNESACQQMPRYFDLGKKNADGTFESHLYNRIFLTHKVIKDFSVAIEDSTFTGGYGAVFNAMVSSGNIETESGTQILRLYSESHQESTLLAEVILDEAIDLNASGGYNYAIEWIMTFENALISKKA